MSENTTPARCSEAVYQAARAAGLLIVTTDEEAAVQKFAEAIQAAAYAEGRKDEAAEWERVGYIGLDAAQRLAAANLGTTTTITKEAPFDDDVALWRRKA